MRGIRGITRPEWAMEAVWFFDASLMVFSTRRSCKRSLSVYAEPDTIRVYTVT